MSKIAFLVSGEKMFKKIKKYIDKKNIIVVEITISNALEEAKKLVDKGVKVILTKLAIKMKIEDEIEIHILNIENNISDYIELLKEIDVKNNKIAFVDYIEAPESLVNLAKIISDDIVFRTFTSEKECDEIVNDLKNEEKTERNILDKVSMNDVEKNKLIEGLKRNTFSLSNTAKDLGMSRTTLWRKLKKFNIIIE